MSPIELDVWYLNIAATIVLLVRLWRTSLLKTYRWFGIYLAVDLAESMLFFYFLRIPAMTHYAQTYMAGQGLKMVLSVFVLLELYRVSLTSRPAIARFGRQTVGFAAGAAALLAALGLLADRSVPKGQSVILYRYFRVERTMDVWALLFLLVITAFMLWFPVKLMRNDAFYLLGFIVYFIARSSGLLVLNLLPARFAPPINTGMLAVSFLCLAGWAFALRSHERDQATVIGHRWDPSAIGRLNDQLEAINSSLLRLSRR